MAIFRFIANKSNHFNSPLPLSQRLLALSCRCSSASSRHFSSVAHNSENDYSHEYGKPKGELLDAKICPETLVGKSASVLRTFTPKSNAQAFLICGGPLLAAHASFDPMYDRARTYIANRPVGNAVLSPVLISGLVGALVEASFPESFMMDDNMQQFTPLIVGVSDDLKFLENALLFIFMNCFLI